MRSLLFVPADDQKKQSKSLTSNTDAIILDLEDSVSIDNKAEARNVVRDFFKQDHLGKKIIIRINALDTDFWQDDMKLVCEVAPDFVILPKARSGAEVTTIDNLLTASEKTNGNTQIIALVTEVPESIFNMATFKNSGKHLNALTWGAEDLSAELGAQTNKDENGVFFPVYQFARSMCLLGAANAEVSAIDTVYTDIRNLEGLRRETEIAKKEGFTSKMLIHPAQIDVVNEVFTPSEAEITHAKAVIDAIENSKTGGVAKLDGQMIDQPHYRAAKKILNRYTQG